MKNFDLKSLYPCKKGFEFSEQFETFEEAWENCPRGDWMLWLAQKLDVDLRTLTLAKALCANTVRHLMKDKRSHEALRTAFLFGRGKVSIEELNQKAAAAAAAVAVNDDAADYAAYYAAADAAADATADSAYYAVYYAAARKNNRKKTADICRKILTEAVFEKII